MENDAELIIYPDDSRFFVISHKNDARFEEELFQKVPPMHIWEYQSYRSGYKTWEINQDYLSEISTLIKQHFGEKKVNVYRGRPEAGKGQLNLFIL